MNDDCIFYDFNGENSSDESSLMDI